jgi:hypothetical protein
MDLTKLSMEKLVVGRDGNGEAGGVGVVSILLLTSTAVHPLHVVEPENRNLEETSRVCLID